jgi:PAS domain S-box
MKQHNAKVKILVIDDDEDDFIITSSYIKDIPGKAYQVDWCAKYSEALQHIKNCDYDLYFVDYRLGAKSGVELLKEAIQAGCQEPIILLTGKGNYEVDIEAIQQGAVDYLIKSDLGVEKLERSVRYALERSATMKAFKANERKYREVFEKSKDIIFIANEQLKIVEINDAVTSILNYTRNDAIGKSLSDFIEQEQHKKYLSMLLNSGKDVNDWEVTLTTKDGEKKVCILTATVEHEDDNYIQGIIHDITNLKKMEKATILSEKLGAAGRLVRTLAHEVRNPLNNITLSIEQLQQEALDDTVQMYLDIVSRNSKRINGLINELLNSSKQADITLNAFALQKVLDDVIDASIDRLTLKRLQLKINYPDEALFILADTEKLKLALLNIVINAIEAMTEGEGVLVISIGEADGMVVLTITDNGCGISEENITRLFEPYFTQKRNGVGLGLAFTLNILQAHKASIEVSSAQGEGTTFTIIFPGLNEVAQANDATRLSLPLA